MQSARIQTLKFKKNP